VVIIITKKLTGTVKVAAVALFSGCRERAPTTAPLLFLHIYWAAHTTFYKAESNNKFFISVLLLLLASITF